MSSNLPFGSSEVAGWAARAGLVYEPFPDESWFRNWEPYDTITPPARYLSSCTWFAARGHVVLVEPWYANDDLPPLDRTLLAFAVHAGFGARASARAGEHFLTRVAFLESPPPPKITLGDAVWDANVSTFARTAQEGAAAFHPRVRKLLVGWGFQGHLEMRPGGMVLHCAGVPPTAAGYERLLGIVNAVVDKAVNPR